MLHLERADGEGGDAQLGLVADEAGSKSFDEQLLMEPQGREGVWSKGCGSHGIRMLREQYHTVPGTALSTDECRSTAWTMPEGEQGTQPIL